MRFKMAKIKAPIVGIIGKIGNAEIGHFGSIAASHELIRGSLRRGAHPAQVSSMFTRVTPLREASIFFRPAFCPSLIIRRSSLAESA